MKNWNLKVLFRNGKCYQIEKGDFGTVEGKADKEVKTILEDSFVAWPVNPDFTGAYTILSMLEIPVVDNIKIVGFAF